MTSNKAEFLQAIKDSREASEEIYQLAKARLREFLESGDCTAETLAEAEQIKKLAAFAKPKKALKIEQ